MKIGLITQKNSNYGLLLLDALKRENIPVDVVIVIKPTLMSYVKKFFYYSKKNGFLDTVLFSIHYLRTNFSPEPLSDKQKKISRDYDSYTNQLFVVTSLNDESLIKSLNENKMDLLLLGQSGIIPKSVIKTPNIGILNAHPGILPMYQGLDPFFWAIFNNDFNNVGSTLHFVNEGIDTGPILLMKKYEWRGDETIKNLDFRLYNECIDIMLTGLHRIFNNTYTSQDQGNNGNYYSMMNRKKIKDVSLKLSDYLRSLSHEIHKN